MNTVIPASAEEIIEVLWARVRDGAVYKYNWGTAADNSMWNVGEYTYINGIMLNIDFDYEGMYLLEVCFRIPHDREHPTPVRWLAVATLSGLDTQHAWYPTTKPQFFFERTVNAWDVIPWAVDWYKRIDLDRRNHH